MATDNTPPRLRLIGTIAVIAIITLVGLDFVFKSYYAYMSDQAQREKLAPTTDKNDQHAAEAAAFAGAKVPMDQAMAQLKGTRSDLVEPKQSDDMAAMTGWSKLPKAPPVANPGAGSPMHADTGVATDGGVLNAGDGGATMTAADGGAPGQATDGGAPPVNNPKTTGTKPDAGTVVPAPKH